MMLFLGSAGFLSLTALFLWYILKKSVGSRQRPMHEVFLSGGELEAHAKQTALAHAVSVGKNSLNWPLPRMNSQYDSIVSVYKGLNEDIRRKRIVPPAAEWLLDNFYILEEQVKLLRRDMNKRSYARLPVLAGGPLKGTARIAAVAEELVTHTDGQMDETVMSDYLKAYQSHSVLLDREIWAIPVVLRLAVIESIHQLCESIRSTQVQWHKADDLIDDWLEHADAEPARMEKLFKDCLKSPDEANPSFIEHLFYRLRRSGRSYSHLLRIMDVNLEKYGSDTDRMTQMEHSAQSLHTVSMGNCITSLHYFATLDWSGLFEAASSVEQILKGDPDGTYPTMDLQTRNYYRSRVAELATHHGVSELHIAREAIGLARGFLSETEASGHQGDSRAAHVGHYLLGKGFAKLEMRLARKTPYRKMRDGFGGRAAGVLYLGSIGLMTFLLAATAVLYAMSATGGGHFVLWLLVGFAVLIPASEVAVNTVNRVVCIALKPAVFPRLELKNGIPEEMSTIIVVPTLLPDAARVKELLKTLECHYLSNRDDHLFFALIGGFKDSDQPGPGSDGGIIKAALGGVKELNRKYAGSGPDKFFFFHRENQYNEMHDKWIGWERKRGALMEFNEMVLGSGDTSFSYASTQAPPFSKVRYIITLDSDTILPMGMARKMIGTMAHPLNRPLIDPKRKVVVEGYGLMQPRIDVDVESSNQSQFSRIFTAQEGLDPYANAISDVYQDLFGEGIYTGKGIYDLAVFHEVLKNAIPDNAILSHDLMEGSYVRTGLVTDLKLVDAHPSRYNAYAARLHRWVRGDWQLLPRLFGTITNLLLHRIDNPLSLLSRWKMLDNLRRSMVAPALMILLALGFTILPGNLAVWIGFFLIAQTFPFLAALAESIFSGQYGNGGIKRYMPVMTGIKASFLQGVLSLAFLPHQAWSMLVAISVTTIRVLITRKNLLEWVTSADMDRSQKNTLAAYMKSMSASFLAPAAILGLAAAFRPETALYVLPFVLFWTFAPWLAFGVSRNVEPSVMKLAGSDEQNLGRIARRTWRYFEEFTNAKSHFLTPDNYQADPPRGVAFRTSPTNIGLGLTAILSARDFGYVGTAEMMDLLVKTLSNMERLEKWNGHFFNWYDTRTLKPLRPAYISTVDSGNLACYLVVLEQGLKDHLNSPLVDGRFTTGLRDTMHCAGNAGMAAFDAISRLMPAVGGEPADLMQWLTTLRTLSEGGWLDEVDNLTWKAKIIRTIHLHVREMEDWMPAIECLQRMPDQLGQASGPKGVSGGMSDEVAAVLHDLSGLLGRSPSLKNLSDVCIRAAGMTRRLTENLTSGETPVRQDTLEWLRQMEKTLMKSSEFAEQTVCRYGKLMGHIRALSDAMRFLPLYDTKKQLFSIGFNLEDNKLSNSHYDLLASEIRQTSYLCIARGEIPPIHWSRMGRALTIVDGYKGLTSWTGTMFEYLMPLLIMKSYDNTLLDETYSFVIRSQKKYGRQRSMPWGASESGFNAMDANLDYQYKAIGVPWLGLKRGLIEDAVTAPYATFLALMVDPAAAIRNIAYLKREGLDGPYGFYEAADYTPERLPFEAKRAIVKSFMAHHQGMSLLALNNFLHGNLMQVRFHSEPSIHAARLLLQEKIPASLLFTKEAKEKVTPFKEASSRETSAVRRFITVDPTRPKAHILTNGNYSVMLTDRGTGYSRNRMMSISRWRSDSTLDKYGQFFYLRDAGTDAVWSATQAPMNDIPLNYEVVFTADKATYKRLDGTISTETEVMVTSGDNVEIRRISLKNQGDRPCTLEVTSCFEVVLAPQASDVAHPAFGNLFVETAFLPERRCIVANRRPRSDNDKNAWLAHAVVIDGESVGNVQVETDRMQWLGRGHDMSAPLVLAHGKPLSNTVGPVLDPIVSLRASVRIEPGKTAKLSFVTAISESHELLVGLVDKYATPDSVQGAFRLALTRSQLENRYLNLDAVEMQLYQDMISDILFLSPLRRMHQATILLNGKGQSALWPYAISGDRPIVLLVLQKANRMEILREVLQAHEYWRLMDLKVDLVILGEEEYNYALPLNNVIRDIVLSRQTHDILKKPEDVFILEQGKLAVEDVRLLHAAARIILYGDGRSMEEQVRIRPETFLPGLRKFTKSASVYAALPLKEPVLKHFNGIGGFRPDGNEYVIHLDKGQNTPAPWVNVIANPEFGFLVSESGSGYAWSQNSRENKLTPWSNDAVSDTPGEVLYLGDLDTGRLWTPTPLPIREDEPYLIKHGFGYSVFEHTSNGIEQWMTQHVPLDAPVKISILGLRNTTSVKRRLSLTYYIQPVLGVSDQTSAMHIRSSLSPSGMMMMENPWQEEFTREVCFLDVSPSSRTQTGDRQEFFGTGGIAAPESLLREGLSGTTGAGFDPCGAIQVKMTLEPNERREIVLLLGMGTDAGHAERLAAQYRTLEKARESLAAAKKFWKEKLNPVKVNTPYSSMNLMLDGWLPYQVLSCRLWAKSGFYQSGGAFGFRDQLQDSLSIAHLWPEITRRQILLHAAHQFSQGDVQHWWHEPMGKGTRTRISDDLLWLPYVTAEYMRITGDEEILQEAVPFLDDPVLSEFEEERYGKPAVSQEMGSLYDHCIRAVEHALRFGVHGLPLMGTGDWNDGMNAVGVKGRGESVWLGWFLVAILDMLHPYCEKLKDTIRAERYAGIRRKLAEAIEQEAWDGKWYRRAWFDNGQVLGSAENVACRIDSIAQTWAVLSGAGDTKRAELALTSLDDWLVRREDGLIKLLTPPFGDGDLEPGYIKGYLPGVRENGGQYTHAAAWAVIAFAMSGNGDKAWELFELINPINHTGSHRDINRYKVEPYVMAADVYSVHPHVGRGGWSWYTGSAGWMYRAGLEYILGFRKTGNAIVMEPCIPCRWTEYDIQYRYLDTVYDIKVKNPEGVSKGVRSIRVDGILSAGNRFELVNDGIRHEAEVLMGDAGVV